ncbi:hypothetical protein [Kitasatospora sp. DSM 101779]|uniref:hypothetical protein n=1 Tax=Kitasatospora sp. DSM 101779 TaxID=2853165 RepID=UPI0021D7EE52|nr:hypothetical protein [Kitasatospora sp. DSM 101779]MCU7827233.1 hypothetical protein [Kitasatospora sp. DSM 101779]
MYQGAEALKYCGYQELACTEVTSMGQTLYEAKASADSDAEPKMRFTLLAYDTLDNAKAGMKQLAASAHESDGKSTPLTIQPGADETDACTTGDSSSAVMRVGTVVAYLLAPTSRSPTICRRSPSSRSTASRPRPRARTPTPESTGRCPPGPPGCGPGQWWRSVGCSARRAGGGVVPVEEGWVR